jgi:hypothetical protein
MIYALNEIGPKRETGEDCKMRSFINCSLHQNIVRVIKSHMEEMRNAYKILVGKPEWKRPL